MHDLLPPVSPVLLLLLIGLYFLPVVVARSRHAKAAAGIAVVNVFLGWTFIGWVVALAWAVSSERLPARVDPRPNAALPPTPIRLDESSGTYRVGRAVGSALHRDSIEPERGSRQIPTRA